MNAPTLLGVAVEALWYEVLWSVRALNTERNPVAYLDRSRVATILAHSNTTDSESIFPSDEALASKLAGAGVGTESRVNSAAFFQVRFLPCRAGNAATFKTWPFFSPGSSCGGFLRVR